MADLVSYEQKHNESNGENNQDGHNDNLSRNWGVEGPTEDKRILDKRYRVMKSLLASLAFSQGTPMIAHGDEIARTQRGNNNAYSQDNDITWIDWTNLNDRQRDLLAFVQRVISIRQNNPVLRRRHFFRGKDPNSPSGKDVMWIRTDGQELQEGDWQNADNHLLGMLINGQATDETDDRGRPIRGDTLLLILNGGDGDCRFTLPQVLEEGFWMTLLDSAHPECHGPQDGSSVMVAAHSLLLLRHGTERRLGATPPDGEPAVPAPSAGTA
jgi:glycogen operon protein